jgi:hypothetical protein
MSTRTPSEEGFLSRWSRRKREGEPEEQPAPLPAAPATESAAPAATEAPEPEVEMVEPPSLDLIDKDFDLASWLKQNVPEAWKLAAMRRAWENDPAIANFENPARDYALDWNTPGGAPGYGPLTESDNVAEMVRGIFGEQPAPAVASLTTEEATGDGMSHPLSSKEESGIVDAAVRESERVDEEPAPLRLSEGPENRPNPWRQQASTSSDLDAAMQQESAREPVSVRVRKRGGGAIPI